MLFLVACLLVVFLTEFALLFLVILVAGKQSYFRTEQPQRSTKAGRFPKNCIVAVYYQDRVDHLRFLQYLQEQYRHIDELLLFPPLAAISKTLQVKPSC